MKYLAVECELCTTAGLVIALSYNVLEPRRLMVWGGTGFFRILKIFLESDPCLTAQVIAGSGIKAPYLKN